jgi:hypothetical protein
MLQRIGPGLGSNLSTTGQSAELLSFRRIVAKNVGRRRGEGRALGTIMHGRRITSLIRSKATALQ